MVSGYGVNVAWRYGLDHCFGFIQTVCAVAGVVGVSTVAKKVMYPNSRPIEPLYNRLRMETGQKAWAHLSVRFAADPYRQITPRKAVILQGRTLEGKTSLLQTSIPWYRRWNVWPLSWICWRGIYLNGAEHSGSQQTFNQWLTCQMFGSSGNAGSEIRQCLWEYRKSQWFRIQMEKMRMPAFLHPMPCFVVVDQFEVLARYHPEALQWADQLVLHHTKHKVARVIFVVSSDYGRMSLMNRSWFGLRFNVVAMEPKSSKDLWKLPTVQRDLFEKCGCNIGLYVTIRDELQNGRMSEQDVVGFVPRALARWKRDFEMPFPFSTHPSWIEVDLSHAKDELARGLQSILLSFYGANEKKVSRIMENTMPELNGFDTLQLFDASMYELGKLLSNEFTPKPGLTQTEAKVVAKNLRKVMGYPVGHFNRKA